MRHRETVRLAATGVAIVYADLVPITGLACAPMLPKSAVLDRVVVAAMSIGFTSRWVASGIGGKTQTTIDVLAVEGTCLRLVTILDSVPVSMIGTNLESVVLAAMIVSDRALLVKTGHKRVTVATAIHSVLSKAVSSLSAVLSCLPISMVAAHLKCVCAAAMDVNGRTLLVVVEDQRMAITASVDGVLREAISSLGTVLDSRPIAMIAALLEAVDVAAVIVDGGALHVAAADQRVAVTSTMSSILGKAVCCLAALL